MALLYNPRFVAFDANGDPISGAQLYTYDSVATSTPKLTYSDAARTVDHENPVVADTNGVFPQIFGAEGDGYYLVLKDADDVLVDEFLAVQTLGQDASSVFLRDFALNGRLKAYGAGGVVNLEFMPPEGDDVGGAGRIGGAEGTQAETLEVDVAATEFTGTVEATEFIRAGVAEPFPRLTASGTASAAATLDIPLDGDFEGWEIRVLYGSSSGTGVLRGRLSFDSASTFKDTAGDYLYEGLFQTNGGASYVAVSTGDYMQLSSAFSSVSECFEATIRVSSKAAKETHVRCNFASFDGSSVNESETGQFAGWTNSKDFGKATHIRLYPASGTMTCEYRVVGLP